MVPRTIEEALDSLLEEMDMKAKTRLATITEDDLIYLHPEVGEYISNGFKLVLDNVALMNSCRIAVGIEDLDEESASFLIFTKLWEKLRETHSPGVV
jgi:hypothetical protein